MLRLVREGRAVTLLNQAEAEAEVAAMRGAGFDLTPELVRTIIGALTGTSGSYADWLVRATLGVDLYGVPTSPCHVCGALEWREAGSHRWACRRCCSDDPDIVP